MIVIVGATGKTGSVAASELLSAGQRVRVVGRSAERLAPLVAAGAEAHVGDVTDPAAADAALAGASAAYLVVPPNPEVDDFAAYQRVVVGSLAAAVEARRPPHVVLLSSLGAQHAAGTGPIVALHGLEERLRAISGVAVLALRAGFFYENFLMNVPMIKSMGANGAPSPAESPWAIIAAADIGRYAARRLRARDFAGFSAVNLVGPRPVSMSETTRVLGRAIGKPELPYVQVGYDDLERGMIGMGLKPRLAAMYVELYRGAAAGLLAPEPGTETVRLDTPLEAFGPVFAAAYAA